MRAAAELEDNPEVIDRYTRPELGARFAGGEPAHPAPLPTTPRISDEGQPA
jgi:hypothetical protein